MTDWWSKALKVIEIVIDHPCSAMFLQNNFEDDENASKIKNPQDFNSIKMKLQEKEYKNIRQVTNDVESIVKNSIQLNGEKSEITTLAKYCYDIYIKELREHDLLQLSEWCMEVFKYRSRITDLMSNLPSKVRQVSASLSVSKSLKNTAPVLSDRDLQNFITAAEKLQTEEDQKEMLRILNENQPELDTGYTELHLEVTRLNHQTISALRKYMTDALAKQGMSYPE